MKFRLNYRVIASMTCGILIAILSLCIPVASGSTMSIDKNAPASLSQVLEAVDAARHSNSVPSKLSPSLQNVSTGDGFSMVGSRGCEPSYAQTSIKISNCIFGDAKGKHTLLILGDSHAAMWLPALNLIGDRLKWRIIDLDKVNCGAADITYYLHQEGRAYTECNAWHQWAFTEINKLDPSVVVLTSLLDPYIAPPGSNFGPSAWTVGLEKSLNLITSNGTKKVVLGDIPYLVPAGQPQDAYSNTTPADCVAAHEQDLSRCSLPEQVAVFTAYHQAEQTAASASGATYINVIPWFCSSVCTPIIHNLVVYENTQHITGPYAEWLSGVLQGALSAAMKTPTAK